MWCFFFCLLSLFTLKERTRGPCIRNRSRWLVPSLSAPKQATPKYYSIVALANGMEATLVRASAPYLYLVARAGLARTCLGAAATHGYVIGTADLAWPALACAACHPRLRCFCCRPLYPAGTSRALAIPSFPQILACVQALASRSIDKKFSLRCDLMQLLTLGS